MKLPIMRITAIILSIVILLAFFAACSEGEKPGNSVDTGTATLPPETTAGELTANLPDTDWEGRVFTFYTRGSDYTDWECQDVFAEFETGEPINDAVYRRNLNVSEKYNIVIKEEKAPADMDKKLQTTIMAGDSLYDATMMRGEHSASAALSGSLIDLYTVNYINLDMPWWDQNAISDFSIGGRLFSTCSDIGISDKDGTWLMVFNKRLLNNYLLDNPYTLVAEDKWVLDNVYAMARQVSADLDGNGVMNAADQWGMAAEGFDTYASFIGCGERVFSKNSDDFPELTVFNERAVKVVEKYMSMVQDRDNYTIEITVRTYHEGNALFMATTMMTIRLFFREMEDDFGMVPVPKFDESQDRYYEVVSIKTSGATLGIPSNAKDVDFCGFVLEALSYESRKLLVPAYYDICFSTKYLRDEDSVKMLDIVFDSRVFELAMIHNWGGWYTYLSGLNATSEFDLASTYAAKLEETNAAIQQTIDAYKDIE